MERYRWRPESENLAGEPRQLLAFKQDTPTTRALIAALAYLEDGLVPSAPEADWDDMDHETMRLHGMLKAALAECVA
jgi:hypothetical protein